MGVQVDRDKETLLTGELARIVSEKYLKNIQRVRLEPIVEMTAAELGKEYEKAELTAGVCADLIDALVMQRFDYLVRQAVAMQQHD